MCQCQSIAKAVEAGFIVALIAKISSDYIASHPATPWFSTTALRHPIPQHATASHPTLLASPLLTPARCRVRRRIIPLQQLSSMPVATLRGAIAPVRQIDEAVPSRSRDVATTLNGGPPHSELTLHGRPANRGAVGLAPRRIHRCRFRIPPLSRYGVVGSLTVAFRHTA